MRRSPDGTVRADPHPVIAFEELLLFADRWEPMPDWFPEFLDDMRSRRLITSDDVVALETGKREQRAAVAKRARERYVRLVAVGVAAGDTTPIR